MKIKPKESQSVKRSGKAMEVFPLALEHGVKIYRGERSKGGKKYPEFTVVWSQGGRRERRFFADLGDAKAEATLAVTRFANGQLDVLNLTGTDRETYMEARRRADILKTPLLSILDQYEAAVAKLAGKATLAEAADYWLRNCDQQITPKLLKDACTEMQTRRKAEGSSTAHLGTLKVYLGQISTAFPEAMMDRITQKELTEFLHSGERAELSARSRNNLRATLTNLFNFAKGEGYLAKDRSTAADGLKPIKEPRSEVEVFSPAECKKILDTLCEHRPEFIPFVVVSLFAGARCEEAKRLDWSDIHLNGENPHIVLAAAKTKTAARRLLPVHPTLAKWLTPFKQDRGLITAQKRPQEAIPALVLSKAKLAWRKNALRHSFISYRLAAIKNAAEVALEAGNSPQIIFRHYRELVTAEDAAAFWALTPPPEFVTKVSDQTKTQ